ncbi:DUF1496 domain-containing protein [Rhodococcus sp. NPDC003348]
MISRTTKTLAASALVALGLIGASAATAAADTVFDPDDSTTTVCVYNGRDYSVGAKIYYEDGTYQRCRADGTWLRTTSQNDVRPEPAPMMPLFQS